MCFVSAGQAENTKKAFIFSRTYQGKEHNNFFSTVPVFALMSTLSNAEPAESDFHSKIVLNMLSTDDNTQVVTVLISKQPELDTEHGSNALCITGMEFKLFKRTN